MLLQKKDCALVVKLFYQYSSNSLAALLEFQHFKGIVKKAHIEIGLKKMIMKFEKTGDLGVLPGRRQKLFVDETVEKASSSNCSSASAQLVSHELEIL